MLDLIWSINHFITLNLSDFVMNNNLEIFIGIMSDTPIFFLPVFLLFIWFYNNFKTKDIKKKEGALLITYGVIISIVFNSIVKIFIIEERPDTIIKPILEHVPDNSFPSDHATVSFAFLFSLYMTGYKKTFWIFMPFVVLMNFARIAGGLHWFFDIIAGLFLGLLSVLFIYKIKNTNSIFKINLFLLKVMSYIKL